MAAKAKVKTIKKTIYIIAAYYPPYMLVEEVKRMNELVCDEIQRNKAKDESPLFKVAGDMNKKKM